jgi:8-oxo-dGTP diphosphatase
MNSSVYEAFGNKIRIRVCGICHTKNSILLINHSGIRAGDFWAPPGGGIEFGETMDTCLKREFFEETGLKISSVEYAFSCEYVHPPLHAIEMFFQVTVEDGSIIIGNDPEMLDNQIIKDVRFVSWDELDRICKNARHGIFNFLEYPSKIVGLKGHFKL